MNKPIIIDGVDVSGCEDLTHQLCCEQYLCEECEGQDCYYKQLQQLKAENTKLKKEVSDLNFYIDNYKLTWEIVECEQYKHALKEINKIVNKECEKCVNDETNENYCIGSEFCALAEINEVLKDGKIHN